eukprot:GHRR01009431.1.p1 GENE.GHRR01009431.1~~GHRR01009431.1.p1  ORF type:complete len:114 (+),score=36.90 GHRR01009431.1:516-857(+)
MKITQTGLTPSNTNSSLFAATADNGHATIVAAANAAAHQPDKALALHYRRTALPPRLPPAAPLRPCLPPARFAARFKPRLSFFILLSSAGPFLLAALLLPFEPLTPFALRAFE